jgi:hypothetical protein
MALVLNIRIELPACGISVPSSNNFGDNGRWRKAQAQAV